MAGLRVFENKSSLISTINALKTLGKTIGFVPTMGALHLGHLSLIQKAQHQCDHVVVSIFVNPLQFNNPSDFERYPNTLNEDLDLLSQFSNLSVFTPSFDCLFTSPALNYKVELGEITSILEGAYRPGHFEGVIQVVHVLFETVQPDKAFFGSKDYQQVAVIKKMVEKLKLPIEIVACATVRNEDGLAMSSRNLLLSETARHQAKIIWETLLFVKEKKVSFYPKALQIIGETFFNRGELQLEYLEIVDAETLLPVTNWSQKSVCCIAAFCGKIRLIDNLVLN